MVLIIDGMTKNQFGGVGLAWRIRRGFRANFLLAFIAGSFFVGVANTSANVTQDLSEMQDLSHWAVLSLENNGLPLSGPAAVATDLTVSGTAVRLSGQSETIVANPIVMNGGSSVTHPPVQSP